MVLYLVRYAEIGLKSDPVRRRFEQALASNIENMFIRYEAECRLSSDRGHLYVEAPDDNVTRSVLGRSFGVVSFSPVELVETDIDRICKFVAGWSRTRIGKGQTFAIRSRRTGEHCFTSRDIAIKVGDAVREANPGRGIKVDLEDPEVKIHIEVRSNKTYVYSERVEGPGGLPYGTQGKIIAMVGGMKDAMACWLLMKRGCRALVIPIGDNGGPQGEAIEMLEGWTPTGRLSTGPSFSSVDEKSIDIAVDLAWKKKASAIVVGETERPFEKRDFPIFYPLLGLPKDMVDQLQRMISRSRFPGPETIDQA